MECKSIRLSIWRRKKKTQETETRHDVTLKTLKICLLFLFSFFFSDTVCHFSNKIHWGVIPLNCLPLFAITIIIYCHFLTATMQKLVGGQTGLTAHHHLRKCRKWNQLHQWKGQPWKISGAKKGTSAYSLPHAVFISFAFSHIQIQSWKCIHLCQLIDKQHFIYNYKKSYIK